MPSILVAVLAHNEEQRIATCLKSLLVEPGDFPIHVIVNGSTDRTAEIAASFGARITVHNYPIGGKSRSWNRFVLDELPDYSDTLVFVDGDAEIIPGSIVALANALAAAPHINAAAGQPYNGRNVSHYQSEQRKSHGIFGDLYALQGQFVARMKALHLRLPEDLVGDDGLIGALAKTDLSHEDHWQNSRIYVCAQAGFLCAPFHLFDVRSWRIQYKRMINYSVRHFQNRIISALMRGEGPGALPSRLALLYPEWLKQFTPRTSPTVWWFDLMALRRMRTQMP